jgi:hypothetical protein
MHGRQDFQLRSRDRPSDIFPHFLCRYGVEFLGDYQGRGIDECYGSTHVAIPDDCSIAGDSLTGGVQEHVPELPDHSKISAEHGMGTFANLRDRRRPLRGKTDFDQGETLSRRKKRDRRCQTV